MGLLEDARNIQRKDPAARSVLEVILLYPGFHILVYHRIAHWLYERGHFFLARWVSQHGRHKTGIEIHPGAQIGRCLFIDHGMGIVFGETTEILVGALEVAESQIGLGEIVTGLKVIMYLERMFKALYRIIVLTHTEGAHAVVLEHIKFLTLVIVVLGGSIVTTQA